MDFILLAILIFYFVRGCWKGFLSMLFSLIGIFFVAILSWRLAGSCSGLMESFVGDASFNMFKHLFDGMIPGTFSSIQQFQIAISQTKIGVVFNILFSRLFETLSFEGALTAGQILAPTITTIFLKVATFLLLFLILELFLKILRIFLNKIIKKCGLSFGNRILGGVVGIVKGLLVFGIVFMVLTLLSHLALSEGLVEFVKSGKVSNFLYNNVFSGLLKLFY